MTIQKIEERANNEQNIKLTKAYHKLQVLIDELNKREIPENIQNAVNTDIAAINSFSETDQKLVRLLRKVHYKTLRLIEKELNLVTKNHYKSLYMAIGVALGVAFSASFDNNGMGMILGLAIGILVGIYFDKKAEQNGNQLNLEC
ncbi:hypothetical protein [Labilibaculum manganireducens]|uniref:hypothetical protein n=1 Tax=Labilibaculum manganireducens TaxID=1940525 RepID=UPI0029F4DAC0|nr:hypothetical protein [Labilibaculum manganireducens]